MTVEDNLIRSTDIPERFQLARAPYPNLDVSDEDILQEAEWIMKQMLVKRPNMKFNLNEPFRQSIQQVLDFVIRQNFEVPFIFQHRKDYLIHAEKVPKPPNPNQPDEPAGYLVKAEKLLNQNDLWEILNLDIKWRAFLHKRRQILHLFNSIRHQLVEEQEVEVEEMCRYAQSIEELQDLHEFVNFKYAALLGDQAATNGDEAVSNSKLQRPGQAKSTVDQVVGSPLYGLVKEFGITADQLGRALLREGRRQFINDPAELPADLAQKQYTGGAFSTGSLALKAAKMTFGEEIFKSPRIRKHIRRVIYQKGRIDCIRTDKGKHRIDNDHPFYEIKYLRRQTFQDIAARPILFLKMLKAEEEGLVHIKIYIDRLEEFERDLFEDHFKSDSYNDLAEAWNAQRREVLEGSLKRIFKTVTEAAKENLKEICETVVAAECRQEYIRKLDQAPWKPEGMPPGTAPAVLIMSLGNGNPPHQPICWVNLRDDGSVRATGQLGDLAKDEKARAEFLKMFNQLREKFDDRAASPGGIDVIGIAGWGASNRRLLDVIQELITDNNLFCSDFPDPTADADTRKRVDAFIINDETARIYQNSSRAAQHHPGLSRLHKYCIGVGKYMQNPLLEYVALEDDILSLSFHPAQKYVTPSKISAALETAAVDMVNLVGLEIDEVIHSELHRNCLKYICGLGPRKATSFLKAVEQNGNVVETREQLVGDPDRNIVQVVGQTVFMNCAAFLYIAYSTIDAQNDSEYLDNTRVHPEDYELGRKMAADALELDELDIQEAQQTGGLGAVVRRLVDNGEEDKVNDLILEEYAEQLEIRYDAKKRATLETIRAELQAAFEELRPPFQLLNDEEIFTMLTGETVDSLDRGDVVPVRIRAAKVRAIEGELEVFATLDCGVEGIAHNDGLPRDLPSDVRLSAAFPPGATKNAKLLDLDRRNFKAELSFIEDDLRHRRKKHYDPDPDEWDFGQLRLDDEESKREISRTTRSNRIIKHAMFRPFNKTQAEEYLGAMNRGDYVIRPSSKGMDHLVITWKVADNVFGHIDVLEQLKDNDFTLGKRLVVNDTAYSDLDELIVEHVYGMVRQVELMMNHERYHGTSRTQVGKSLCYFIATLSTRFLVYASRAIESYALALRASSQLRSRALLQPTQFSVPARRASQNTHPKDSDAFPSLPSRIVLIHRMCRSLAYDLHRSKPPSRDVRVLSQPSIPRILLAVLEERASREGAGLEREGGPQGFRAEEQEVPGCRKFEGWVQDADDPECFEERRGPLRFWSGPSASSNIVLQKVLLAFKSH